jgi:hypothetical protein
VEQRRKGAAEDRPETSVLKLIAACLPPLGAIDGPVTSEQEKDQARGDPTSVAAASS